MSKRFKELRGNLSNESLWTAFTNSFENWLSDPVSFEQRLETNSNLWPNLLRENSNEVGLPVEMAEKHELKLKTLVARRNDIAHGKKVIISTLDDYQPYEDAALLAMHELAVAVLERIEKKEYLEGGS